MKANPEEYHLLTSSMTLISIKIGHKINNSKFEKLLVVKIEN